MAVRAVLLKAVYRSVIDVIDRALLVSFLLSIQEAGRDVPVVFFDISVREVSEDFDAPTFDAALEATEAAWGGGTAIGTVRYFHLTLID